MLADLIEPTIREIAHLIVQSGAPISGAWAGYTKDEDLIPLRQESDDNLHFVRARNGSARVEAFNIHPVDPDPRSVVFYEPTVQRSESKASASITIDNLRGLKEQPYIFKRAFNDGEAEEAAVKAGFSLTSKTKIGTGDGSPYSFSQEFSATVSSEWSNKTGRNKSTTTGGEFPLIALPSTKVTGFLAWDEQDLLRRISCIGTYDFGLKIGRRAKSGRRNRWRWYNGYHLWNSIENILATAEGRGSVHFPLFEYWGHNPPPASALVTIRARPQVQIDQYVPYKGTANIRVVIDTLDDLRSNNHNETPEGD